MYVLTQANEKYKGDTLLQKAYIADFLTKRVKKNCRGIPQYYIKDSHPAIIDPATFDLVQKEIEWRRPERHKLHCSNPFTAKVVCGDCGGYYGRKVWHSNSKHRKYIWRCNQKYEEKTTCSTPNLDEATLKATFEEAFNRMLGEKEQYIAQFEEMLPLLADTSKLERQLAEAQNNHSHLMNDLRLYMEENTWQIQDQTEYNRRFSELDTECKKAEEEIEAIQKEILAQSGRKEQIRRCLDELRECGDTLDEFDDDL